MSRPHIPLHTSQTRFLHELHRTARTQPRASLRKAPRPVARFRARHLLCLRRLMELSSLCRRTLTRSVAIPAVCKSAAEEAQTVGLDRKRSLCSPRRSPVSRSSTVSQNFTRYPTLIVGLLTCNPQTIARRPSCPLPSSVTKSYQETKATPSIKSGSS